MNIIKALWNEVNHIKACGYCGQGDANRNNRLHFSNFAGGYICSECRGDGNGWKVKSFNSFKEARKFMDKIKEGE